MTGKPIHHDQRKNGPSQTCYRTIWLYIDQNPIAASLGITKPKCVFSGPKILPISKLLIFIITSIIIIIIIIVEFLLTTSYKHNKQLA